MKNGALFCSKQETACRYFSLKRPKAVPILQTAVRLYNLAHDLRRISCKHKELSLRFNYSFKKILECPLQISTGRQYVWAGRLMLTLPKRIFNITWLLSSYGVP
jgi:hypothetical protein